MQNLNILSKFPFFSESKNHDLKEDQEDDDFDFSYVNWELD
jgi:hypothetical protein